MPAPVIVLVDAPSLGADGVPRDPGAIAEILARDAATVNQVWHGVFGHGDFSEFPATTLATLQFQKYRRMRLIVALDRDVKGLGTSPEGLPEIVPETDLGSAEVIGSTQVRVQREDNSHLADEVEIAVRADWRRRGVGSALQTSLETLARAWGCTIMGGFSNHVGTPSSDLLMPAEGPFGVGRDDAATRFALAHGYHLAQGERHSMQMLPADPARLAHRADDGYEMLVWGGPIDPALAEPLARLRTSFETSVPMGELDYRPAVITAERVIDGDRELHRHRDSLTAAVRHRASQDLVGFTQLIVNNDLPEPVWQGITVVVDEHRGHGLGLTLKQAALEHLQHRWPRAQRVHTWNAGENDHMWTINESLGYVTAGVAGAWQKTLA